MKKITSLLFIFLIAITFFSLTACGSKNNEESAYSEITSSINEESTEEITDNSAKSKTEKTKSASSDKASNIDKSDGLGKKFKKAMDSYEDFIDEYVEFMKKYSESDGTDMSMIADYADYMGKYADMVKKFDKWENEDLNDAELAYYIDVQARVSKKLLEVAN